MISYSHKGKKREDEGAPITADSMDEGGDDSGSDDEAPEAILE